MKDFTKIDLGKLFSGQRESDSPIKLVGIRAALEPSPAQNRMAVYDDIILRVIDGQVTQWVASTDPSWTLVQHPISGVEFAMQLQKGLHLFRKFYMHGRYHCLRQSEDVHIERLNRDGTVNHTDCGDYGVCIHSGGAGMDTGRFSAGCQIIENPDGYFGNPTWESFWGPIRDGMTKHNLTTVPYLLIDVGDLS